MIKLKGSEKQIKWAEDIRDMLVKCINDLIDERQKEHEERGKKRTLRMLEDAKEVLNKIESEESSKYFIDNFSYILRNINVYKSEAKVRSVSLELIIAYEVKEILGL